MHPALLTIYVPEPVVGAAAVFYGAVMGADPAQEWHGTGPVHFSITCPRTGFIVEVLPAGPRPRTTMRLEFRGDADAAVLRLMDAHELPERTRDGRGWWVTDPVGNVVVLCD